MADTSATQDAWTHDQMTLRRRARRRLVGAVAIALAAVLILPMVFDPEPRPLGPDVDIRIPAPSTPFEMAPAAETLEPLPTQPNEPSAQVAEPTLPVSAGPAPAGSGQEAVRSPNVAGAASTAGVAAPAPMPERSVDQAAERAAEKATQEAARKAAQKAAEQAAAEARAAEKKLAEKKAADKAAKEAAAKEAAAREAAKPPLPKPTGAFASQGFYLQLGVFASASNARQLQEKVEAAGFKVGVADSNGQYRVRVGPIPERDRALEVQARLKGKGFTSIILGP